MRHNFLTFIVLLSAVFTPLTARATTIRFRFPMNIAPSVTAYYDHDTGTGAKNYQCSANTVYNGHRGTDFAAPVGTPVYSGAIGTLYYRYDGCPTYGTYGNSCGGGFGNHARVDHEGNPDGLGWISIYAHLQKYTVTQPRAISCGSAIGKSGSSGNSTGPHLHFEIRKFGYPNDDPYAGRCSQIAPYWTSQPSGPGTQCYIVE